MQRISANPPYLYEFPSSICRSDNLSVAPSHGEKHVTCDTVSLYKDTISEDEMEFCDLLTSVRAPTQHELKIAEHVAAYSAGDMDKVARIDESEEERRTGKAYHCDIRKYCANASKASSLKGDNFS